MKILVLDLHRRNAAEAFKITQQLDKYTQTSMLSVFSPDFSYDVLKAYDGIVLSGSDDRSVYYDPKIRQLTVPLKQVSREGIHVLGICGGNQVLAKIYGYRRYKLNAPEVAWRPITITEQGQSDPLFHGLERRFVAFEQHILAVRCDDKERILAENETCVQAILYQPTVRGIQFHPEESPAKGIELLTHSHESRGIDHTFKGSNKHHQLRIFPNFVNMIS